jgi:hypothetical protein
MCRRSELSGLDIDELRDAGDEGITSTYGGPRPTSPRSAPRSASHTASTHRPAPSAPSAFGSTSWPGAGSSKVLCSGRSTAITASAASGAMPASPRFGSPASRSATSSATARPWQTAEPRQLQRALAPVRRGHVGILGGRTGRRDIGARPLAGNLAGGARLHPRRRQAAQSHEGNRPVTEAMPTRPMRLQPTWPGRRSDYLVYPSTSWMTAAVNTSAAPTMRTVHTAVSRANSASRSASFGGTYITAIDKASAGAANGTISLTIHENPCQESLVRARRTSRGNAENRSR